MLAVQTQINNYKNKAKQILKNKTFLMGLGTLISRILGQIRSILLVLCIGGTTLSANAFDIANTIPNIFLSIIGVGFLNSILIPQIVRAQKEKNKDERLSKLLTFSGVVILSFTFLLTVLTPFIVNLLVSDNWSSNQVSLAISFAYICMPQLFFYGLYALLGQFLNANSKFTSYYFAPVLNNIVNIIGLLIFLFVYGTVASSNSSNVEFWGIPSIFLLAGFSTLGIITQALVLIPQIKKLDINFKFIFSLRGFEIKKLSKLGMWTLLIVLSENILNIVCVNITSSAPMLEQSLGGDPQSVGGNYAFNLGLIICAVPTSIFTTSLISKVFTDASNAINNLDPELFFSRLINCIQKIVIFEVYSMAIFCCLSKTLTTLLVPSADISTINAVSQVIFFHVISLGFTGVYALFRKVYFILENSKKAFLLSIPNFFIYLVFSILVYFLLPPKFFGGGVSLVSSISTIITFFIVASIIGRDIRKYFTDRNVDIGFSYFDISKILTFVIKILIIFVITLTIGSLLNSLFPINNCFENITNCKWLNNNIMSSYFDFIIQFLVVGGTMTIIYFWVIRKLKL